MTTVTTSSTKINPPPAAPAASPTVAVDPDEDALALNAANTLTLKEQSARLPL